MAPEIMCILLNALQMHDVDVRVLQLQLGWLCFTTQQHTHFVFHTM